MVMVGMGVMTGMLTVATAMLTGVIGLSGGACRAFSLDAAFFPTNCSCRPKPGVIALRVPTACPCGCS